MAYIHTLKYCHVGISVTHFATLLNTQRHLNIYFTPKVLIKMYSNMLQLFKTCCSKCVSTAFIRPFPANNIGWPNVGPTSVLSSPCWPNLYYCLDCLTVRDTCVRRIILVLPNLVIASKPREIGSTFPSLTHWGWNTMSAILQTTFFNSFSWMKIVALD